MHLTSRRRRALAVVLTAAVAAVAPMGAAGAQTKRHTDATADLFRFDENTGDVTPAPEQVDADITTWSLTHSTGSVTIRAAFTDLTESAGVLGFDGLIRTDEGHRPEFELLADPGRRKGRLSLTRSNGRTIHCTTSHTIDYEANTVVIKMARACFDKPTWVRAELISFTESSGYLYGDDGLSAGHGFEKLTGRAYRG